MRNTAFKASVVAFALLVAAFTLTQPAEAGRRGNTAAAAIIGLGVGAIIGGAIASDRAHAYEYAPPPPPRRVYYYESPPPWSPAWYDYCAWKYRSFDPRTGTYIGVDGYRQFCH